MTMTDPVDRAVRAIARRNSFALVLAQFGIAHLVMLGGLALLSLYHQISLTRFLVLVAVSQALVLIDNIASIRVTRQIWAPVRAWEAGARDERSTVAAWRALATLPLEYLRRTRRYPLIFSYLPFIAFTTWELGLRWYSFGILAVAGTVVLAYGLIVRYFTMEVVVRPVLEEVSCELPGELTQGVPGLPLRWRLLLVAPTINVITGVVVAGLSAHGHHAAIRELGVSWLIAVAVSFTFSLELVILVARSLGSTMRDLREATEQVRAGDYSARVPVVATDETGALARSFNMMVEGLDERERLRSAFGAYVDPRVAERVVKEGVDLAGEELEVTVLFLDVCGFSAMAERLDPSEVVSLLNDLWDLVVPVVLEHGGHANKFIGDGVLAMFGAPGYQADHAEQAVRAGLAITSVVAKHYEGRISVGIGINTGRVIVGTVGGGGRVEFTAIGDAVNVAARVEKATRETDDDVLITAATRERLPEDTFICRQRSALALPGRSSRIELWAPALRERRSPPRSPGGEVRAARGPGRRRGTTQVSE
ncbi:MAG: adenylate cyclase [Solirubrobacteraceae bacterium]|jgi:adenylate cyclase|nr:adenylate cyclase [Solirubrobacteraceae bacterium]